MSRDGSFSEETKAAILASTYGLCARCCQQANQAHHRRARGMGGTRNPLIGQASNGVPLCAGCHEWVERNRLAAIGCGWILRSADDWPVAWWAQSWGCWLAWRLDEVRVRGRLIRTWHVDVVDGPNTGVISS